MASPCIPAQASRADVDRALTPERVSAIWRYARDTHMGKGLPFEDVLNHTANDLNMPRDWVARAFTKPKSLRIITDQMFLKQHERRMAVSRAKLWVETADTPGLYKVLATTLSIPRRILTFGHGPVFTVTHALDIAFSEPVAYAKATANAWRYASPTQHAKAMDWLGSRTDYTKFERAGLELNIEKGPSGILTGGSGGWARRAWDALKVLRYEVMEQRWNALPKAEQTSQMAKLMASQINHATGVMSPGEWGFGKIGRGMFAPQLTASKIAKTFIDPLKTAETFRRVASGEKVPFAERYIAALRTRKAATYVASYAGLLTLNQALIKVGFLGDKDQKVNWTDPMHGGDFLRPKAFGHTLNTRGTSELLTLAGKLIQTSFATKKELHGKSRVDSIRDTLAKYAQYKLAPNISLLGEAATREDLFGRPLPWSDNPGSKNKPRMSWPEWSMTHSPIYLGGASREIFDELRERGVAPTDAVSLMRALVAYPDVAAEGAAVGAMEFVGGGIHREHKKKP